ncbi:Lrp/AsnC family transcriptional regulator [Actinomadura syzygii]|uniref:Lrp/AsnC family transcriptional regulator n=1 Tax=Actinomadura syzygii TaxID=1427538 RepID=A0A5D0TXD3_9ACTN|nr:Lrp/AsnC ligand binding domain-containing protein [Actinomadura syzygii]TYC10848.1 Lrp/AsnC family transcriptional regulator [Actinomadura syzygii]
MVTAIVFVKADVARIHEVAETIAAVDGVSEVYSITGDHDLMAMVRVRRNEDLNDIIPGRINKIPGIVGTETHIAFRTYSQHDLEQAFALGLPDAD